MKNITEVLKNYKENKVKIEVSKASIKAWEYALENIDSIELINSSKPNDCWMMKFNSSNSYNSRSAVEEMIVDDEKKVEILRTMIQEEKSRIYPKELEINQLEKALDALTKEQKIVIECKYFEKMFWREIEDSYNQMFKKGNYLTESGLKKIRFEAVEILKNILKEFYDKTYIA